MPAPAPPLLYRFGTFEADPSTGELRRKGVRIKLNAQPFQLLCLLLDRPNQLLTREEIATTLWPEGTFVDFDHGLNSAINRIREALGDSAANPRFLETLARRGYRFLAPVERIQTDPTNTTATPSAPTVEGIVILSEAKDLLPAMLSPTPELSSRPESAPFAAAAETPAVPATKPRTTLLATPADLPKVPHTTSKTLYLLLQLMYLSFYIGALANLPEIAQLFSPLPYPEATYNTLIATAAILIPARIFVVCATLFQPPRVTQTLLRLWPFLLLADLLWSLAPFLLLHHIDTGVALACTAILLYSPFAQRSLILMGAAQPD